MQRFQRVLSSAEKEFEHLERGNINEADFYCGSGL